MSSLLGVYVTALLNKPFWSAVTRAFPYTGPASAVQYGLLFLALASGFAFGVNLLLLRRIGKALVGALLLASAWSAFFMETFGTPPTSDVWERLGDVSGLVWHVLLYGAVPAVALAAAPVGRRNGWREVWRRARFGLLALAVMLAAGATQADTWQNLPPGRLINPVAGLCLIWQGPTPGNASGASFPVR